MIGDRDLKAAIIAERRATRRPTNPMVFLVVAIKIIKVILFLFIPALGLGLAVHYGTRSACPPWDRNQVMVCR